MDDVRLDTLGQTIVGALPGAALAHEVAFGQLTIAVETSKIVEVAQFLRDDPRCRFVNFTDATAVDYPGREKRFDVVYHLMSPTLNTRIRLQGSGLRDDSGAVDHFGVSRRRLVRARSL